MSPSNDNQQGDLSGCKGILVAIMVGGAMWAIIILLILWGTGKL